MSDNRKNTTSVLGLLAFFAIIIKALAYLLTYINGNLGILTYIADIIISFVSLIVAWQFAKTCSKFWKLVYLIVLILVIIGFVFGGLNL